MDHPFNDISEDSENAGALYRVAKKVDRWALENPYQTAAIGAVVGLASSMIFNRLLLIKGTMAVVGCVYGAVKGAATGYTYPTVRAHTQKIL